MPRRPRIQLAEVPLHIVQHGINGESMDGVRFALTAGMQTSAEIMLGTRTVAEYLLSPVRKAWHEAGRER